MVYWGNFGLEFKQAIVLYEISALEFREKMKIFKFGIKNT